MFKLLVRTGVQQLKSLIHTAGQPQKGTAKHQKVKEKGCKDLGPTFASHIYKSSNA